jgi:hypothetical protein
MDRFSVDREAETVPGQQWAHEMDDGEDHRRGDGRRGFVGGGRKKGRKRVRVVE